MEHLKEYQRKVQAGEIERTAPVSPIEKAKQNPKSLRYAINAMCFDCSGYSKADVKRCHITTCPLHRHRPWQAA